MTETARLRAGDDDRERVVELLRVAHVEGRLDEAELGERTGAAYSARFLDELPALTADLPGSRAVARRELPQTPARRRRTVGPPFPVLAVLGLFALVASIGALSHSHPPVPLLWFGLALLLVLRHRHRPAWGYAHARRQLSR